MPWEKSFDETVVLEKATEVFWKKGYEPASINDLLKGTGLNRGSLYNAFGGKRALFTKALASYDQDRRALLASMEALDDPRKAVGAFFDEIVDRTVADQDHKGCFLFNTALEFSCHDEEVKGIVTRGVGEIEAFFKRCIEVGQVRNEISKGLDPLTTARTLMSLLVSIRVLGRGVYAEAALRGIAGEAKKLVGP